MIHIATRRFLVAGNAGSVADAVKEAELIGWIVYITTNACYRRKS